MLEGRWTSNRGVPVEIGALMVDDGMSVANFLPRTQVRASSAV
jgi:hypothetical protein